MLQRHLSLRSLGLGAALGAAILSAACSSTPAERQQTSLNPAGLPTYRAGQKYTFSDGGTRRVLGLEGRSVRWSKRRDRSYLLSPNFIVPVLNRDGSTRVISHEIFGSPDNLWPLRVGNTVRFRTVRTTLSKRSKRSERRTHNWWCEVPAINKVTVPAGTFDTYRIECERLSGHRQTPSRRYTWYYAPKLGHFVRRDLEILRSRQTTTIELTSVTGRKAAASPAAVPAKPRKAVAVAPKPPARRFAVHLASYRDATAAVQGWSELKARFPSLLAGKQPVLEPVDLGDRGVFQRLLAVPFASRPEAENLCSRLTAKAVMQYCLVTMG